MKHMCFVCFIRNSSVFHRNVKPPGGPPFFVTSGDGSPADRQEALRGAAVIDRGVGSDYNNLE